MYKKNYGSSGASNNRGGGRFGRGRSNSNRGFNRRSSSSRVSVNRYISEVNEVEAQVKYVPTNKFSDFNLNKFLYQNIEKKGYVLPTKIQDQAIPAIMEGKDIIGLASTGSGKTAAFLIPLIDKLLRSTDEKCLIVAPTREIATQIQDELFQFTKGTYLRSTLLIGGNSISKQIFSLSRNIDFVIATPGRLKDIFERRRINLGEFNNIVLDEVDRMLDMGFINDIRFIVSKLNSDRQSLFFSATMNNEAEAIANTLLRDPVKIQVEKISPLNNIKQDIIKIEPGSDKVDILHNLLIQEEFEKVLVFSRTKRGVDMISRKLTQKGINVDGIHGDKSQYLRAKVITKFKNRMIKVLIATDVAARGIDIPDVTHVINFDEPENYDDYIHRIGRTGRIGKLGKAITFIDRRFTSYERR